MNVLLLALALGLPCLADDNKDKIIEFSKEGTQTWNTIFLAANSKEKISENGPLRLYMRSLSILEGNGLGITFYVRVNCSCRKFAIKSSKTEDTWYTIYYYGKNYLQHVYKISTMYIIFIINLSKNDEVTSLMLALAPGHDLSTKNYEFFKAKTMEKGVPIKNIIKVSDTDTCPHK